MGDLFGIRKYRWRDNTSWRKGIQRFLYGKWINRQIVKYQKNFWSVLNDRNKISKNILLNHHVKVIKYEGKKLLEIDVPAADRHDKPVYVGTDPMRGTYRRDFEGDFLCTEASVRAMFAFFYKVTNRIDDDVAVPFVNRREGVRVDRVDIHDALSEAVANALVHANYYGKRGIVIVKHGKKITISNPGTIRITKEEFFAGGNSDPRNPNLLKIFGFVNVGERAGSGVDKIMTAWEEQNWEKPMYDISLRAERVTLQLEVGQVVYIPGAADIRKNVLASATIKLIKLTDKERLIVEYIQKHGSISMGKATEVCGYKTKSATRRIIAGLLEKEVIEKQGNGPATRYVLIEKDL